MLRHQQPQRHISSTTATALLISTIPEPAVILPVAWAVIIMLHLMNTQRKMTQVEDFFDALKSWWISIRYVDFRLTPKFGVSI